MSDERAGDEVAERAAADAPGTPDASRRATVTTSHADAATAQRVAAALRPDNTAEMATRTEGERVVTTVERDATGGLASTLDDYVVNATVAAWLTTDGERACESDTRDSTHSERDTRDSDTRDSTHSDTPTS